MIYIINGIFHGIFSAL